LKTAETMAGTIPSSMNEGMKHMIIGSTLRTGTPLAQLLPVLATVFGSELSMMIIISPHDPYWRRPGDLMPIGVTATPDRDQ
jgi:hypothetical protein